MTKIKRAKPKAVGVKVKTGVKAKAKAKAKQGIERGKAVKRKIYNINRV